MQSIVHLTSRHVRDDIRVFYKMCLSSAKQYETTLVVFDGFGNTTENRVSIRDLGRLQGSKLKKLLKVFFKTLLFSFGKKNTIFQIHDPELIPVAMLLKLFGSKIIYDMHEHNSTQILIKPALGPLWFRKIFSKFYYKFETLLLKFFDAVLVPQICMQKEFSKYNSKTFLIANFPDIEEKVDETTEGSQIALIYSGAITEQRGIFNILNMLELLGPKYRLILCGNITDDLLDTISKHSAWEKVEYLGRLNQTELTEVYKQSDIGLILFNNVGQYYMAYSLKLFEYMKFGMYILMPNFGDWIEFNQKHKVGTNVDVESPKLIASVINKLDNAVLKSVSRENRNKFKAEFNWASQESKLLDIYKSNEGGI